MIKIYSQYRPPELHSIEPVGDSLTVQGIVTSLSEILSGHDDNNMHALDLKYSGDDVVDLYPEVFGRPTKYELEYYNRERQNDVTSSDVDSGSGSDASTEVSTDASSEASSAE